jgi:nicotinate dehydrogenase subunit B
MKTPAPSRADRQPARPARRPVFSRRRFLQTFTGGLAVLWLVGRPDATAQAESGGRAGRGGNRRPTDLAAWLHIAADGTVTVFSGKVEIGQNVRTAILQATAEELPTPLSSIKMVLGDTAIVPFDNGTFGSRSTPEMFPQIRRVAATAREGLLDLAARQWQVGRETLTMADGRVRHATSNRSVGFGELTRGEKLVLTVSDTIPLKPATEWKVAGTSVPKVDARNYITGRHAYASDIQRPDMLHGRVLRPAAFGATLAALDSSAAEAIPGVKVVRDGDFVGVVAPTEHEAAHALAVLRADWKTTPQVSERELFAHLKATARNAPKPAAESAEPGSLQQSYTIAYIAHTPLEPRAAVAEWRDRDLLVWAGTQRPFGVRGELMAAFGLPEERVRVMVPDTGSGYGGKHTGEAAVEAARLAKAAGQPVKVIWTREEEFTWAYSRPAGLLELRSAVAPDGRITRWEHHNYNSGNAALRSLYDVPGKIEEFHPAHSPLRQGSYRGLAGTANHFAREVHIDELAQMAQLDPVAFRLKNLSDPRAHEALEVAAKKFGWNAKRTRVPGTGAGLAFGMDKGGYLACFAEVKVDPATGKVRVARVVQTFDCGAIVNPDQLKNQVEGAIVQGIGAALFEAVRFDQGRILNPRLSQYRVPRFSDTPAIEVVLIDRKDIISAGAGECPLFGIAPAISNAIFDAVGVRLRAMPLAPNGVKVG